MYHINYVKRKFSSYSILSIIHTNVKYFVLVFYACKLFVIFRKVILKIIATKKSFTEKIVKYAILCRENTLIFCIFTLG